VTAVSDLPQNDVPAALRAYRDGLLAGTWSPEQGEALTMLQTEPAELLAALAEVAKEPAIAAALERMRQRVLAARIARSRAAGIRSR